MTSASVTAHFNDKAGPEIHGARDLGALWRALPMAGWRFPMRALPQGVEVLTLGDALRGEVWRSRCASLDVRPCVERRQSDKPARCDYANSGRCRADTLIPVFEGGGALQWRSATLFVHWHPSIARAESELRLVGLGETACDELAWAARFLAEKFNLGTGEPLPWRSFNDLVPPQPGRCSIELTTPWLVAKLPAQSDTNPPVKKLPAPGLNDVQAKLIASLSARGLKFSALCSTELLIQRMCGHLARHVAEALVPHGALRVIEAHLSSDLIDSSELGEDKDYNGLIWKGCLEIEASDAALPWLGLAVVTGLGANVDKGFGRISLTRSG